MVSIPHVSSRTRSERSGLALLAPVIDWIDRELTHTYGISKGRGGDTLLKLRRIFSGNSLNSAIGGFYRLLPRLERHHFLLSYRIRRWLAVNFEVLVSDPLQRVEPATQEIHQSARALASYREDFSEQTGWIVAPSDVRVTIIERGL